MLMAKKKIPKKNIADESKPAPAQQSFPQLEQHKPGPEPMMDVSMENAGLKKPEAMERPEKAAAPVTDKGAMLKIAAIALLGVLVVVLAYYFLVLSSPTFIPGSEVDVETFKGAFASASKVYIVMDIRGISNESLRGSIMQCGVDFAGSTPMGGKQVVPMSFSNTDCTIPPVNKTDNGIRTLKECASMLKDGLTIQVKEGPGGAKYYSNGMVVFVRPGYEAGTCGMKNV
jgi:hypothetical protein